MSSDEARSRCGAGRPARARVPSATGIDRVSVTRRRPAQPQAPPPRAPRGSP